MELAAVQFGFLDLTTAMGWYASWLRLIKIVLARHFPQPTLDIIKLSSPPKMIKKYGANVAGVLDCVEQRHQIPTEKMAQRATWSEYKAANTSKYLVDMAPAGFTRYISMGYPGRISDPQICTVTAFYTEEGSPVLVEEEDADESERNDDQ